jgi:hypothetical protein
MSDVGVEILRKLWDALAPAGQHVQAGINQGKFRWLVERPLYLTDGETQYMRRVTGNADPHYGKGTSEMDLHEAVMLVVFDIRKSNADFSARDAVDHARANVDRSDVVDTGGDLEIAFLAVLDAEDAALNKAVEQYVSRVMPTRSSGRLSPMAQDVIMHARHDGDGVWSVDTDVATFGELESHGLVIDIGGDKVLTALGECARQLIPIL